MLDLDEITGAIIHSAMRVHRALGSGLLESVHEAVLARALVQQGFDTVRQKPMGFEWEGIRFDEGFRADLVVDHRVIVEIKSVARLAPVHGKQLLTYLRLSDLRVGLLLNFGAETMKDGIQRIVNDLPVSGPQRLRVNQPRLSP